MYSSFSNEPHPDLMQTLELISPRTHAVLSRLSDGLSGFFESFLNKTRLVSQDYVICPSISTLNTALEYYMNPSISSVLSHMFIIERLSAENDKVSEFFRSQLEKMGKSLDEMNEVTFKVMGPFQRRLDPETLRELETEVIPSIGDYIHSVSDSDVSQFLNALHRLGETLFKTLKAQRDLTQISDERSTFYFFGSQSLKFKSDTFAAYRSSGGYIPYLTSLAAHFIYPFSIQAEAYSCPVREGMGQVKQVPTLRSYVHQAYSGLYFERLNTILKKIRTSSISVNLPSVLIFSL